jgi:hypothetical protein
MSHSVPFNLLSDIKSQKRALLNNGMKMMLNDLKLRSKSSCFSATPKSE